ncbi:MAG: hypothetical protein CVV42_18760 [Candidatus Riflebacteria bacterium HGW-Riflebacteria-2]|nr:MAG: hypothetical protein CVV42_18760 [Candidatus Riflebacteria bacterium HGW-Riflebacteria-2]
MNEQSESIVDLEKRFRAHQWVQLFFATVMVILPFFLAPAYPGEERVALGSWRIPPVCPHRVLFMKSCPGCGLIRSFTALTHGQFRASYAYHRLGIPLFLIIALQIPFRLYLLKKGSQGYSKRIETIIYRPVPYVIAILVINWLISVWA